MAKQVWTDLDLNSASRLLNLPAPASADEPARLADLSAAIEGLKQKDPCAVATQGNTNLASPGATVDGVTMSAGDRVLVKAQTAASENGLYSWNGAAVAMTRTADASTAAELTNALVPVNGGTNAGQNWRQTAVIATLGTDAVTWAQFGVTAAQATETSAGIAEIATQTETDTGTDDQRFITPLKLATWSGRLHRASAVFGDGTATQFDITHNFGTRDVLVEVYRVASPYDTVLCGVERLDTNTVRLKFTAAPTTNQFKVVVLA